MIYRLSLYLLVFWLMQVVAQLFFKWGSASSANWLWGFLGGNLFGFSSIWLLMLVYRDINPNVALGLATAGGFLFSQIALALVFKTTISPMQWAGILAIIAGVVLLAGGGPEQATAPATEQRVVPD